jgi:hypothetical protein
VSPSSGVIYPDWISPRKRIVQTDCPIENLRHHDMNSTTRNFSGVSCISYQLISPRFALRPRFSAGGKLHIERQTAWKTVVVFRHSLGKLAFVNRDRETRRTREQRLTPVDCSRLSRRPARRAPSRGNVGPVRTCVVGLAHLSEHSVRTRRVCAWRSAARVCDRTDLGNDRLRRSTARLERCAEVETPRARGTARRPRRPRYRCRAPRATRGCGTPGDREIVDAIREILIAIHA